SPSPPSMGRDHVLARLDRRPRGSNACRAILPCYAPRGASLLGLLSAPRLIAALSPDGTRIVATVGGPLRVLDLTTGKKIADLYERATNPAWSGDGRFVAFVEVSDVAKQRLVVREASKDKPGHAALALRAWALF